MYAVSLGERFPRIEKSDRKIPLRVDYVATNNKLPFGPVFSFYF